MIRAATVTLMLERRTEQSALLLRDVLVETPPGAEAPDGGSNSLRQWRRRE